MTADCISLQVKTFIFLRFGFVSPASMFFTFCRCISRGDVCLSLDQAPGLTDRDLLAITMLGINSLCSWLAFVRFKMLRRQRRRELQPWLTPLHAQSMKERMKGRERTLAGPAVARVAAPASAPSAADSPAPASYSSLSTPRRVLAAASDLTSDAPDLSRGGTLEVHLVSAKHLMGMKANGLSDAYASLSLGPAKLRSATVNRSLHPRWNERFYFHVEAPLDELIQRQRLSVKLVDHDKGLGLRNAALGDLSFPLDALRQHATLHAVDVPLDHAWGGSLTFTLRWRRADAAAEAPVAAAERINHSTVELDSSPVLALLLEGP